MRHLLPIVAALLLVSNAADAQTPNSEAATAAKASDSTKAVPKTKNRPASFFLEEITPPKPAAAVSKTAKKSPKKVSNRKVAEAPSDLKKKIAQQSPISSHFQQGIIFQSMNMGEHAITEYRDALKDDPKFASTYNNLAQCLINRNAEGDKEEALKLLTEANKLEPENLGTVHALGVLKERDKDYAGAEAAFTKVLKNQPLNISAIKNLSELYFNQGQKEKAREVLVEAIRQYSAIQSTHGSTNLDQQAAILKQALANLDKPPAKTDETKSAAPTKAAPQQTAAK
ncbi:MAG: tetratricopeptide repeat protein [Candidatus Obscuribacterales bacterium]|nr:tetratricopeptide repeat protein [Candidatus Obscuribacterales bacterium]